MDLNSTRPSSAVYFDEPFETLPLPDIRRLQDGLWSTQWDYVRSMSTFYRAKFSHWIDRKMTLDSLEELPFTEKAELRVSQENDSPFGDYLACGEVSVSRLHRTSGTTGRPLIFANSKSDAQWIGIDPVKAIGRPLDELIDFEPIIGPIFSTGVGYVDRELIIDSPARHLHLLDTAIPITNACGRVVSVVNTFREFKRIRKIVGKYAGSHARYTFENIVGKSTGLLNAVASARKAARGSANLLLSGESGVGKEVFAQAIHNDSERQGHPFIAINCAALPHDLIESELFGHAPGSFTGATREGRPGKFESADGGTVFLDEISELPVDVQAKLLRVLQEREVTRLGDTRGIQIDVRIICASNRDLQAMVRAKAFREDLYYRCNVIDIAIPPLRQRQDDIPVLASFFVAKYAALLRKNIYGFTPRAMQQMSGYTWPGNVRELENFVERMVNLSEDGTISDVGSLFRGMQTPDVVSDGVREAEPPQVVSLAEAERRAIEEALRSCAFNMTRCATVLAVSKPALYAKLKRHGIRLRRTLQ
jgi:sigma-54 dependent transcriptional regulator, acetoin dehydrogenase operon transcriptional activator AcoR